MINPEHKYKILETIYYSSHSIIFRALNTITREKVIIKTLNRKLYNLNNLYQLKHEHKLLDRLGGFYVVKPHEFVNFETSFALVIEDIEAISLSQFIVHHRLTLKEFIVFALKICQCLDFVHSNQVIHKDINPSNIVYNPQTETIKLIDFGISSEYSFEALPALNPNILEGTLPYMSPEQTGRMNRPIDYRTDFYSLGITLYEMACGRLPFDSPNPAEIVHSHIAITPVPVHRINSLIPECVSKIIDKLMSKMPEARYKSIAGIVSDLERCREIISNNIIIDTKFEPGQGDLSDKFEIPRKLYGRDSELNNLLVSFERIRKGKAELILIGGYSGIGKTTLVNELHKPIIREQGIFISGKYDQYTKSKPFSALFQAMDQFCRYILSEPEISVERWKHRILEALAGRGRLIIEHIPRLEFIIGEQPSIQQVSAPEEQACFKAALKNLILAIPSSAHPVVFFMDDIHWADMASLELFETVLTDSNIDNLMFIGAYRDNEVDAAHPLLRSIDKIRRNDGIVQLLALGNLTRNIIEEIISDISGRSQEEARPLAEAVVEKTLGNPFYIIEFINQCHKNHLIFYDHGLKRWQWDEEGVRTFKISNNVADYLIGKIGSLPRDTQELLAIASCLGNNFNINDLAMVSGKNEMILKNELKPAIASEMIYATTFVEVKHEEAQFKFCHDKFQQAGYQTISEGRRQGIHLSIARYYASMPEWEESARLFVVAEHYSKALNCLHSEEELNRVIDIFFKTAHAAILSSAFDTARKYLELIEANASDEMTRDKSFLLHLYCEFHLVFFSLARFDEMDLAFTRIGAIIREPLDLVDIYCIQLISLSNRSRYKEAFFLGVSLLEKLGVYYPQHRLAEQINEEVEKYYDYEHNNTITMLEEKPIISGVNTKAIAKLINRIAPAGLFYNPLAAFWAICLNTNLMIERGITPWGLESSAAFMPVLIALRGDYRPGYTLTKNSIDIAKKKGFTGELYRMYHTLGLFTSHWFEPLGNSIDYAHEAFKGNLDNGEFEFSCFSYFASQVAILETCESISDMQCEVEAAFSFASKMNNYFSLLSFVVFKQLVKALKGETFSYGSFNDEYFQEETHLIQIEGHAIGQCYYSIYRALLAVIFGDFQTAFILTESAIPYLPHMTGFYTIALHNFLNSLSICRTIEKLEEGEEKQNLNIKLRNNQVWLEKRAQDAPFNFQHLYNLINAEILSIEGEYDQALQLYEKAIILAKENKRPYHYALFCELAGQRYTQMGVMRIASIYLREAYSAYLTWETTGKTEAMKEKYPQLVFSPVDAHSVPYYQTNTIFTDSIDLSAVAEASQAISVEIERKKLIEKIITIIMKNSGSNRGYLLLKEDTGWMLSKCEHTYGLIEFFIEGREIILDNFTGMVSLPVSVVSYVARTKEALIIDSVKDSQFALDSYFIEHSTSSALCFPVLFQNILKGIVYLENDLMTEAFSPKRLEVLNILASQAAISLENSALFSELDNKVALRTRQLEQEIAEHKKTENALKQSEERFSKAFHSCPAMMAILRMEDHVFIEINQSFLTELEFTRDEVSGHIPLEIGMWADQEQECLLFDLFNRPKPADIVECKLQSKSGKTIYVLASTEFLSLNNRDCQLIVMQNINEKKQYEANMFRMDRLNLIGEMAAGIGHEIRNPMTAIRGFLQLLSSNDYYEKDHMYFELMIEELDRANGIISEYLGMAKDKRVDLKYTDLDRIIHFLFPIINADANYQGMEVKLELGTPPMLLIDEKEIRQMILNMARNGLEAMSPGGILTIQTKVEKGQIVLAIKDQGQGLSPDILDKLGTPFVTTKEKGTGLGLAVCYSIAARHQANIGAETGPQGTTFKICFPMPVEQLTMF
ncbi:MAG: AAA family ATPase [Syntrophomonas sp.]